MARPGARRLLRAAGVIVIILLALYAIAYAANADVRYLTRAAFAEGDILRRRRPIAEVVADSATDPRVRGKLLLVLAARTWAAESLGLKAGESFTTYTQLDSDTLVLVLSAARADTLVPYTWTYPIVGRVPYKGYFDPGRALREAQTLQRAGLDTYVRPASAFSTLGWFNDPLVSPTLRADSADLAATVIHELLHNTLFVPGHVDFNESFAEFVGYQGAERFFRSRGDSLNAWRTALRWEDEQRLAAFYADLVRRLDKLYGSGAPKREILSLRADYFRAARDRLAGGLGGELRTIDGRRLSERPLNNAVLLSQRVYASGFGSFDSLLTAQGGDLRALVADVKRKTAGSGDPWEALGVQAP